MEAREQLRKCLEESGGKKYVVAVSGGRDSMALLGAMLEAVGPECLVVGHFDHRTRGGESRKDAEFVAAFCAKKGIGFHGAEREGKSMAEAALRDERWAFLKSLRRRTKADFIVTAHHLQDQLETFLMRLVRGTGIEGLAAMAETEKGILRPWLNLAPNEIPKASFREDATNRQPIYFRNRVRQDLLPPLFTLAEEYGGGEAFLRRFAGLSQELQKYRRKIRKRAKKEFKKRAIVTPYWVRVKPPVRASLLRGIYQALDAEVPSRARLGEILAELDTLAKKATLPGGVSVESSCGQLFFQNSAQRAALKALPAPTLKRGQLECAALGLKIKVPATLAKLQPRFFRPGDRQGKRKLKEEFLMRRIPAPERRLLPLLSQPNSAEVAWYFSQEIPHLRVKASHFPFSFLARSKNQ